MALAQSTPAPGSPSGLGFPEFLTRLFTLYDQHPRLIVGLLIGFVAGGLLVRALLTPVLRRAAHQFWYQFRNAFTADAGWRDILYWLVAGLLIALPIALVRGYGRPGDKGFHWGAFCFVLAIFAVSSL